MGTYSQHHGARGEEARRAWLIWADLPEGETCAPPGGWTDRQSRREGITGSRDSLSKHRGGGIVRGSLLESTAWQGEKIQVQKVAGKGQV